MMKREIRGITFFSLVWEIMIFGGFICANEFAIKNLIQAYEWFFYFMTVLASLVFFLGIPEAKYQYTKAKFNFEIVTNTLLGIMLAYYGYFVCASILTFFGYGLTAHNYFIKESKNEKAE
ncbi:hypothetical protein [Pasteurella multocida]|uniref:hypothetical protein n=1 Tax=Pasteurella multocida TaxID=747 RepID=UPI001865A1B6|nr:hypothetical protein [Pasteurella multocida]MCL7759248.1 hypothetical protein [Pasteurella multocida]MCL7787734.1 hypothetical protein [Pasteurella multocida]MDX3893077.1 hypothetical protein [Pasteurella multocida]BDE03417.1 hypothetical protein PASm1_13190 [Pasteurella multocida]BDE03593.1 hypothetical protein PASm1_14950 [Pasteurella multocida]